MEWYIAALKKYADFRGRAQRKEYWMFVAINFLFSMVLILIDNAAGLQLENGYGSLFLIYSLAMLLPQLSVSVRRLHDVGKSGWMLLIIFVPFIGTLWLLSLLISEGSAGNNTYGSNPKGMK